MKKLRNLVIVCMAIMVACMLQNNDAKAAEVGKYELSDTSVNKDYDVTGDGVKDKVEFKKLNKDSNDGYTGFKVIINGTTAFTEKEEYYYSLNLVFIQTQDHGYFLISSKSDNDYGTSKVYECVDGTLEERMKLDDVVGKVYYQYDVTVSSVKEESFMMKFDGQTNMLARTKMCFGFNVDDTGNLSLANKVAKVAYSNIRISTEKSYKSKYLVTAKKLQAYRSSTETEKAFTIKKGTKLKITKVSVSGKTPRYYCVTNSGKKGWVISKQNVFKDLMYAG